jgi:hypothetical protein
MADQHDTKAETSSAMAYSGAAAAALAPEITKVAEATSAKAAEVTTAAVTMPPRDKRAKARRVAPAKVASEKIVPVKTKLAAEKSAKPAGTVPKSVKAAKVLATTAKSNNQAATGTKAAPKSLSHSSRKEKTMETNAKFAEGIQKVVAGAQSKAKLAAAKGSNLLGEAGEFTKGNVEAVAASGKILAEGLQAIGKQFVAEGRDTFEMVTGEVKELAAVRSPSQLLKVQSDIARKNLDAALSLGSKNSEAMLKLASGVMAPIVGRFSLAAEKVRKTAA